MMKKGIFKGTLLFVFVLLGGCAQHYYDGHGYTNGYYVKPMHSDCHLTYSSCRKTTVLPPVYQAVPAQKPCGSPCGSNLPPVYQPVTAPCAVPCGYQPPVQNSCVTGCNYPRPAVAPCSGSMCSYPMQNHVVPQPQANPTSMVYPIDMSKTQVPGAAGVQTYLYRPASGVVYQY